MSYARQLLDAYPRDFNLDAQVLAATIDALSDCAQACTACADDCLSEPQVGSDAAGQTSVRLADGIGPAGLILFRTFNRIGQRPAIN